MSELTPLNILNLKTFGAKVDGTTDDSAAWAAIFAMKDAIGGAEIVVPQGTSVLTLLINTGTKAFRLRGIGWDYAGGSIRSTVTGSVILCSGSGGFTATTAVDGAEIRDLAIVGNGSGTGILVTNASAAVSRWNGFNVMISNWSTAIRFENCEDCVWKHTNLFSNTIGIDMGGNASHAYCDDMRFYDTVANSAATAAIRCQGIQRLHIHGGVIQGNTAAGILLQPDTLAQPVEGVDIEGLYFEANPSGHIVFDTTNSSLKGVTIDNCHFGTQTLGFVSGANNFFGLYIGKGCDFVVSSTLTIPSWVTAGWSECQTIGSGAIISNSNGFHLVAEPRIPFSDVTFTTTTSGNNTAWQQTIPLNAVSEWAIDVIAIGSDGSRFSQRGYRTTWYCAGSAPATIVGTDSTGTSVSGGPNGATFFINVAQSGGGGGSLLVQVNQGATGFTADWRISVRAIVVV